MQGIGIDAVDIQRFRELLIRRPQLRTRLFTEQELTSLSGRVDDAGSLAARFAVREATMKALGVGLGAFEFHDVWVQRAESARPSLAVTGRAEQIAHDLGVTDWHLSITHTDSTAIAYVIAVRSPQ